MKLKLSLAVLALAAFAYGQDAASDVKDAAKDTGHATKKAAKKTGCAANSTSMSTGARSRKSKGSRTRST